jgi:hypothetical protein
MMLGIADVTVELPTRASALRELRAKYPYSPPAYFELLAGLNRWEGFVGENYTVLFDAATAVATDEYEVPTYCPGYFALGSNGGGELRVCTERGIDDRPIYFLPAIGMKDAGLMVVSRTASAFAGAVLASARSGDA